MLMVVKLDLQISVIMNTEHRIHGSPYYVYFLVETSMTDPICVRYLRLCMAVETIVLQFISLSGCESFSVNESRVCETQAVIFTKI